eukprot:scaffold71892_cov80-Phaeocystis_antarctica.AAC.3
MECTPLRPQGPTGRTRSRRSVGCPTWRRGGGHATGLAHRPPRRWRSRSSPLGRATHAGPPWRRRANRSVRRQLRSPAGAARCGGGATPRRSSSRQARARGRPSSWL